MQHHQHSLHRWQRLPSAAVVSLAYLAGAVPFSNLMARWRAGVDLREVGTGTVSGSELYKQAGTGPLVVAGLAEVAKGALGPTLAGPDRPRLAALAGGAAVCGHNWSPFLAGAGGRGFSVSLGALAVQNWPGAATLLAGFVAGEVVKQQGLGVFVATTAVVPVLYGTRGRTGALGGAAVVVPALAKRVVGNRRPARRGPGVYLARLVLDRDTWTKPGAHEIGSSPGGGGTRRGEPAGVGASAAAVGDRP